ncbi:hypothetical protein QVD17_35217 [Tagetes erecta]|uniref:ABC transporter domain-containing protein n=1 Tax=Tagetes erecta TaxID=13708 RepID=A0AAD8K0L6_TARER|nr:hypothetical protein QVD17_35217 [Tagetes erecta]
MKLLDSLHLSSKAKDLENTHHKTISISLQMINKKGCEIEASGINYTIYTQPTFNFFNIHQQSIKLHDQSLDHHPNPNPTSRRVLREVTCHAKPWEVLAIVGPSGAGKSSLLEVLAGKLTPQTGSIFVNGRPMDTSRFKKISGYVTQKDTLFPLLTVEETLVFTAKLRLNLSQPELSSRVKSLIRELGLSHVANARVGDDRVRGISGGERRRVSIGVAVVHNPEVVILDEPTSGLDSNCAFQIIDMVKTMAETRGKTVILSIHQPGFRIIKLFNSILLLANGTVLHQGSIDELSQSLRLIGLEPPLHVNIVEFAIDSIESIQQQKVINQMTSNIEENITPSSNKMNIQGKFTLQQLFQQSKVIDLDHENDQEHDQVQEVIIHNDFANSRFYETLILTHRFWKNISRTKELFACRTLQMLVSGLILGSIFYNLDMDLLGAQERVGLFAFILTFLLSTTVEALPVFLQEREILMKETSCGSYRVSSYAIANGLVYLPFLLILAILFATPLYWLVGLNPNFLAFSWFLLLIWLILYTANSVVVCFSALVPNFIVGNSVISGVMGSFFLFSGYFVSKQGMPKYWIFMHYISLFKYPFEGLLMNEFHGGEDKCLEYLFGKCLVSGEDVLRETGGYVEEGKWKNIVIMVCFILVYRFISYVILRVRCSQKGLKVVL